MKLDKGMCIFAQYSDIFGTPRQGFHETRIPYLDVALWDTIGTIVIAIVLALIFDLSIWLTVSIAFCLAIFLHYLFCVKTKLTVAMNLV